MISVNTNNYNKILDKAKKLKALAEGGIEGEMDNAKKFYKDFILKHNINEDDIEPQRFNRVFKIKNIDYEVILSHIIISVKPNVLIDKKHGQFKVVLDDEDFIEVNERLKTFYSLFNREKKLFLMAFLESHKDYFTPDEESVKKHIKLNDKNDIDLSKSDELEQAESLNKAALDTPQPKGLSKRDMQKVGIYKKCFDVVKYTKANRKIE